MQFEEEIRRWTRGNRAGDAGPSWMAGFGAT